MNNISIKPKRIKTNKNKKTKKVTTSARKITDI